MRREEIRIGQRVFDRVDRRSGTVLAFWVPANPKLAATEALVQTGQNAISIVLFENLEILESKLEQQKAA